MLISIGQFSKICAVSIKTLRYYDKVDILKPEKVDKFTGYRYYSESQLDDMLIINRLKRYGFALIEIKSFLSTRDKRVLFSKLKDQENIIKTDLSHKTMLLKELTGVIRNFERTGEIMHLKNNYEVELTNRNDTAILSSRQNMGVEDFDKYFGILFTKIAKEGINTTGDVIAIYHDNEWNENNSDIEIAISIKDKEKATRILKGGLCATTIHKGAYANLSEAYASVVKWIKENGYQIAESPYEFYRKSYSDNLPVEEWETDIYFPIKK